MALIGPRVGGRSKPGCQSRSAAANPVVLEFVAPNRSFVETDRSLAPDRPFADFRYQPVLRSAIVSPGLRNV
jgi:hypothetical protein